MALGFQFRMAFFTGIPQISTSTLKNHQRIKDQQNVIHDKACNMSNGDSYVDYTIQNVRIVLNI